MSKSSYGLSHPPGPKALPIVGNILDIPKEIPWVAYAAWDRQYGDVISVTALGKVIVVVNSAKAAKEVFERRGMRYMDRPKVPILELMGWNVILALSPYPETWRIGLSEDDIYESYFIPKGAMVLENSWAILHDPDAYPDPEAFNPDRFLTSDGRVKDNSILGLIFGCGRRICPGRHLVDSNLWLIVASMCCFFNVGREKDEHGNEIPVEPAYTDGLICHPKEFACSITPRSKIKAELIASSLASAEDGRS